jgi:hypothetical protein
MNTDPVSITRRFSGLCETANSKPHPQGLARRFDFFKPPPADDLYRITTEEFVIKDQESLLAFVARIPEKDMGSPKPNDDPILERPKIDFDTHMVLVIVFHEPNCFIDLNIEGAELTSQGMRVLCRYSEPGPIVAKIISDGTYCAVLVPRFDGEVIFAPYQA